MDNLLLNIPITLQNNIGYDYVYIANMCLADFMGESVPDEQHMALYIKNVIDDIDAGGWRDYA